MTLTLLKGKSKKKKLGESYTLLILPDQDLEQWLKKTGLQVFTGHCGICNADRLVNIPSYKGKAPALSCGTCPECGDSENQPFTYVMDPDSLTIAIKYTQGPKTKKVPLRLVKIDENK